MKENLEEKVEFVIPYKTFECTQFQKIILYEEVIDILTEEDYCDTTKDLITLRDYERDLLDDVYCSTSISNNNVFAAYACLKVIK